MAITSKQEHAALSRAAALAELAKCKAITAADAEHVRAAFWSRAPEQVRMFVCFMAGLDKAKGKGALAQLSAGDRARINAELRRLIPQMESLLRCAQGGKTHDHGEMAAHCFDGITGGAVQ